MTIPSIARYKTLDFILSQLRPQNSEPHATTRMRLDIEPFTNSNMLRPI